MVTEAPVAPEVGERLVIVGTGLLIVKFLELLATLLTVTTTLTVPLATPEGTAATMDVLCQLLTDAATPPNLIVLCPCELPKLLPLTVTDAPDAPEVGERLLMVGAANSAVVANTVTARATGWDRLRRIHVLRDLLSEQRFWIYRGPLPADVPETLGKVGIKREV